MASVLITIFNMSIAGSIIVILALIARFFMRKLPKKYTCILWGIVCLRLICPFGISLPAILNLLQGRDAGNVISLTEYIPQSIGAVMLNPENTPPGIVAIVLTILFIIWFLGFAAMSIYEIAAYNNARKRLATAIKIQERVFETDQISTPFIFGLVNPKIYVPVGMSENELRYVLCHEFIHIKRKDYLIKFFECFILALHWFNPFVWCAFKHMAVDMEMSCDEKVVDSLNDSTRKEYAELIFSLSQTKIKVTKSMLTFGASDTRVRVKNILNKKKTTTIGIVAAAVVCAALLVVIISNSAIVGVADIVGNGIYTGEVKRLSSTDLSGVAVDEMKIGSDIADVDLSIYPDDRPNTTGNYSYFFNQVRVGVDEGNRITSIFAAYDREGAKVLNINGNTGMSTIDEIANVLGNNYLDKIEDREQRLRKHIYYDSVTDVKAEFVYSEYDGIFVWIVLKELE